MNKGRSEHARLRRLIASYHSGVRRLTDSRIDKEIGIQTVAVEKPLMLGELLVRYGDHRLEKGDLAYRIIRTLYRALQPYLGQSFRMLDLGSGYGRIAFYGALLRRIQVSGIEIVKERVEEAERARQALNLRTVTFTLGNVNSVEWPEADCICLMNSITPRLLSKTIDKMRDYASSREVLIASHSTSNSFIEKQKWLDEVMWNSTPTTSFDVRLFVPHNSTQVKKLSVMR